MMHADNGQMENTLVHTPAESWKAEQNGKSGGPGGGVGANIS